MLNIRNIWRRTITEFKVNGRDAFAVIASIKINGVISIVSQIQIRRARITKFNKITSGSRSTHRRRLIRNNYYTGICVLDRESKCGQVGNRRFWYREDDGAVKHARSRRDDCSRIHGCCANLGVERSPASCSSIDDLAGYRVCPGSAICCRHECQLIISGVQLVIGDDKGCAAAAIHLRGIEHNLSGVRRFQHHCQPLCIYQCGRTFVKQSTIRQSDVINRRHVGEIDVGLAADHASIGSRTIDCNPVKTLSQLDVGKCKILLVRNRWLDIGAVRTGYRGTIN
ncbi:hypothetical protein D3C75_246630 [compost metagenome]